jgi:integrase
MKNKSVAPKDFIAFFQQVVVTRLSEGLSCFNYDVALQHLQNFLGTKSLSFESITVSWFESFRSHLSQVKGLKSHKPLSQNSANTYFRIVLSVAKDAADHRFINHSILIGIRNTHRTKSGSSALTNEELQRFASTPCRVPVLKNAFLFSCLTGMSWKQMSILKWKYLTEVDECWQIEVEESGEVILVVMNSQARQLLGNIGKADEKIFKLHYSAALCVNLNQWALKAGVHRNITFNLARQTFGKMLLDREVPIELVSEMLGHRQLKTTQKLFGLTSVNNNQSRFASF